MLCPLNLAPCSLNLSPETSVLSPERGALPPSLAQGLAPCLMSGVIHEFIVLGAVSRSHRAAAPTHAPSAGCHLSGEALQ